MKQYEQYCGIQHTSIVNTFRFEYQTFKQRKLVSRKWTVNISYIACTAQIYIYIYLPVNIGLFLPEWCIILKTFDSLQSEIK